MQAFDRAEVIAEIRERADSDAVFRARLVEDPSAAVSDILGMSVPETVRFTVHQETSTDIHLVIPVTANLDDADLELVAGGGIWGHKSSPQEACLNDTCKG